MKQRDILIIGGTGVFGKRLVRHLAGWGGINIHVSSRTAAKAAAFTRSLKDAVAPLYPCALDCQVNLVERLTQIRPFIVVDCSGPFQNVQYDTAHKVIEAGAHFIDLADARDYLADFGQTLDGAARHYKVAALTGASSTPTLSTCAVKALARDWVRTDTIDMCITPGGKSEVGRSVIEAIMSYAGKSISIWREGHLCHTTGWQDPRTITIPGLGRRRVAAVETFDAEYLGPRFNVRSRVSFSAGLESWIEQRGIEMIAALRKRGVIGSPKALIPALLQARKITRIPTSSSGGMLVEMTGLNADGVQTQAQWSLIAQNDHGPFIPILPAAAVIRKLLSSAIAPGACFAHKAISLEEILHEMEPYDIATKIVCQ